MSKKVKEDIEISNQELQPTVLYTIKEKKGSFLVLFLVFALFIGVVYFLPMASEMYQKYKKGEDITFSNNKKPSSEENNPDDYEELVRYDYSSNPTIKTDDIIINQFTFSNGVLSFNETNSKTTNVNLTNKKYFLEIYDNNDTLVKRIKVGEGAFNASETKTLTYTLNSSSINYFYLKEIDSMDYPAYALSADESGASRLTCQKDESVITYTFTSDKLVNIIEVVTLNSTSSNYAISLSTYNNLVNEYRKYNGVEATATSNQNGYVFNFNIDPTKAPINSLNNLNYYSSSTAVNVINFEVEARGYNCN